MSTISKEIITEFSPYTAEDDYFYDRTKKKIHPKNYVPEKIQKNLNITHILSLRNAAGRDVLPSPEQEILIFKCNYCSTAVCGIKKIVRPLYLKSGGPKNS